MASLAGHIAPILSLTFDQSGTRLATTSVDHTARVWNIPAAAQQVSVLGLFFDVAFSPDAARIATAGNNGIVSVWDSYSGERQLALSGHSARVLSVAFGAEGETLASGGSDETTRLWDSNTGRPTAILFDPVVDLFDGRGPNENNIVFDVTVSPSGDRVATQEDHRRVKIWSSTGELLHVLEGPADRIAFSPDGTTLAVTDDAGQTRVWSVEAGLLETVLRRPLNRVVLNPEGDQMVAIDRDGDAVLWHSKDGDSLRAFGRVDRVQFSSDGTVVLTQMAESVVTCWRAATGRRISALAELSLTEASTYTSSDGALVVSAQGGSAILWNSRTGESKRLPAANVDAVRLNEDAQLLATVSTDGSVWIWDATTSELLTKLSRESGVAGVTFQSYIAEFVADTDEIVTAGTDGTLRLWNSRTGEKIDQLPGVVGVVTSMVASPNGRSIAAYTTIGQVHLWLRT
jgi:WD40 repeat protein